MAETEGEDPFILHQSVSCILEHPVLYYAFCEHPVLSERIVMTPKKKTATSTSLAMERKRQQSSAGRKTSYVAGGEHQGIVINKVPQLRLLEFSNVDIDVNRYLQYLEKAPTSSFSFLKVPTTILDRNLALLRLFS